MNKKVIIALSVVLLLSVGAIIWVLCQDTGPNLPVVNDDELAQNEVKNPDEGGEEVKTPGVIPNVITKSGLIKSIGKDNIVISGENDKNIKIYITDDTEIYGPDGKERTFKDLKVGVDITADIDGDEFSDSDKAFDAMIIYIAGK